MSQSLGARRAMLLVATCAAGLLAGCDDGGTDAQVEDATPVDMGGRLRDAALPDAEPCEVEAERCDGADNDCDGEIDEDFADEGAACALGEGPCASPGTWRCAEDGMGLSCDAPPPRQPEPEACNGLDDDCDGAADEGIDFARSVDHCGRCNAACVFANAEPACDEGVCVVVACAAGFGDANGVAADGCECPIAGAETCNGVDDDCDGQVDEDFALAVACVTGAGACVARGLLVCGDDGGLTCDAPPVVPQPETCNGRDDDCDGAVDETFDLDQDGHARCDAVTCAADEVCPDGLDCAVICARQDCNDDDGSRSPSVREVCADGIDQNCDGHDAPCSQLLSRVNTLVIVTAENTAAQCADFDGDGIPDNAFAKLAPIANPLLVDALNQGSLELLPTLNGALPDLANGRVDLSILLGRRVAFQQYSIRAESYDAAGEPLMSFPNALLVAGDITAGPGDFVLGLPVPGGMPGDLRLSEARVTATVALNGVSVRHDGGRVVGVVTEADLATALETVPPNLLPVIQALLEPDLDRDNDGVPDAYSACITYTSRPVSLAPDP